MILADSFLCKCIMRVLITEVGGGGMKASDSGAWREEVLASRSRRSTRWIVKAVFISSMIAATSMRTKFLSP